MAGKLYGEIKHVAVLLEQFQGALHRPAIEVLAGAEVVDVEQLGRLLLPAYRHRRGGADGPAVQHPRLLDRKSVV